MRPRKDATRGRNFQPDPARLLHCLQETLRTWFSAGPRTLEIFESKRHRAHASKQLSPDFVPFLFVCAFLVVVICLVSKQQPKERSGEQEQDEEEEYSEGIISSLPTSNETLSESSASSAPAGEARSDCDYLSPRARINEFMPALSFTIRDRAIRDLPDDPDSARSSSYASALSVDAAAADQQVRQNRQKRANQPCQARVFLDREWFVRRTRSGQIYGTYAF